MARASTPTLLSLDRYAQILGITPAHFNQGVSGTVFPLSNNCPDVWYQHGWQNVDAVSREDLALEIANAERDIAEYLGWWPAPIWIAQDVAMYPRWHRPEVYGVGGMNTRGQMKSIKANYGKIIEPGQRAVGTRIGQPTVGGPATSELEYSTADGDAFDETVTVTQTTTLTDECEVKIYFTGHDGDPEWEIRPARTKVIEAGLLTATFWSWQFIDPDLWEEIPTADFAAIDLDAAVYVNTVDVYREYNDPTATSAVFYWEGQPDASSICAVCLGTGCAACQLTTQNGCAHIRDAERGLLVPVPATYDETDAQWESASWSVCRDPDQVKLYYYCGDLSWLNLAGRRCDALSNQMAQTIAMLATARLERPFCRCGNSAALAAHWREDLAFVGEKSYNVPYETLSNPFGTKRGEIQAWQRLSKLVPGRQRGATAI